MADGGSARNGLDILVQPEHDPRAAVRFFRRLLKGPEYVPRVVVTDKLCSAGKARRFLAAFSGISPHFRPRRHLNDRRRPPR